MTDSAPLPDRREGDPDGGEPATVPYDYGDGVLRPNYAPAAAPWCVPHPTGEDGLVRCAAFHTTVSVTPARPTRAVADNVWGLTCEHTHIPSIPVVTFMCGDCGFGAWSEEVAEHHATVLPDHAVYPCHHQAVPHG